MRKYERDVVAACADAMFSPNAAIPVSGTEAGIAAYVREYLADQAWLPRWQMRLLFLFVQLSPLLFGPRFARFTKLDQFERNMVLTSMYDGLYIRHVSFQGLKAILTMAYGANPTVKAIIRSGDPKAVAPPEPTRRSP